MYWVYWFYELAINLTGNQSVLFIYGLFNMNILYVKTDKFIGKFRYLDEKRIGYLKNFYSIIKILSFCYDCNIYFE